VKAAAAQFNRAIVHKGLANFELVSATLPVFVETLVHFDRIAHSYLLVKFIAATLPAGHAHIDALLLAPHR
jgi:hypothetical protein